MPIRTSFSTEAPRPTTLSAPISLRSRTCAWSATTHLSPMRAPASTTAAAPTVTASPSTAGGGCSRDEVERAPSDGGLPSTQPSPSREPGPIAVPACTTTFPPITASSGSSTPPPSSRPGARSDGCSTRALLQRPLERLEHPHHAQARLPARARLAAVRNPLHEVAALDEQRLLVRHARGGGVPGAGDVLAVGREALVEALVVDGELALQLHVVECRHLPRADHREAALLVRVEPGQMHVRRQAGREAQVAEDHVLDALLHVALANSAALVGHRGRGLL